jgi:hypothetical protein
VADVGIGIESRNEPVGWPEQTAEGLTSLSSFLERYPAAERVVLQDSAPDGWSELLAELVKFLKVIRDLAKDCSTSGRVLFALGV